MRKISLLIVLAAFAAAPAAAAAQERKLSDMTPDEAMQYNKKNLGLVVKGLPLILPSWAVPLYFGMNLDQEVEKATSKKETRKKKKR